jgi:hypothetical protein
LSAARQSAYAAIANAQAATAQVEELRQSATDTHDLAKAAQSQAVNTEKLANAAISQVAKLDASVREAHALAKATQEALGIARENFIKDQQPYIWISPEPPKLEAGRTIRWDIRFSNYGRSAAYNVKHCTLLTFGIDALSDLRPLSLEECEQQHARGNRSGDRLPSGLSAIHVSK